MAQDAGETIAEHFLDRAQESFGLLAEQAQIGPVVPTLIPALAGVRKWWVRGFDRFLIFYIPIDGGVRIIRILHSAQDWWGLLNLAE